MLTIVGILLALFGRATPANAQITDQQDRLGNANLVIRNVHVVDTETGAVMRDRAIAIRDNVILAIMRDSALAGLDKQKLRMIDGHGAFAIPPLWDAHVHLMQNGAETARAQAAAMVGHGILHVRDMGSSLAARSEILPLLRAPEAIAPRIISSGPTLWTFALPYGDASGQTLMADDADIKSGVRQLAEAGADFLKVYAGFDAARLKALAASARGTKLTLAGHAQTGMTLSEQARIGMRTIEHLDFATLGECTANPDAYFKRVIAARFRNTGEAIPEIYAAFAASVDTAPCAAALRAAVAAGLVLTPTMVSTYLPAKAAAAAGLPPWVREGCTLYRKQFDGLRSEVSAALPAAGRRMLRMIVKAKVPLLAGSDTPAFCATAGSALIAELDLLREGGVSPLAVLQSATLLPGRLFGGAAAPGRIRVDGPADVLLLAANPLTMSNAYARPLGLYDGRSWRDARALARLRVGS